MLHSVHLVANAITGGWLALLVAVVAFVFFARRCLRAWMLAPLLAFPVGLVWYRLWWDHDWFGTPRVIHGWLQSDGEGSYDATFVEMVLILWVLFSLLLGGARVKSRMKRATTRQTQRPWRSRGVRSLFSFPTLLPLVQAARRLWTWLIFGAKLPRRES
jgi:hypothetical protein